MSDLNFVDALEKQFVIYIAENTYDAGLKMVQEYIGGEMSDLKAIFRRYECLNNIELKTKTAATLQGAQYEKIMHFCKK